MDFSSLSETELIDAYGSILNEMRAKNLIRTKNVTGDLGEYIVVDYYAKTKGLPKLQFAPPSTKILTLLVLMEKDIRLSVQQQILQVLFGEFRKMQIFLKRNRYLNML